MRFFGSISSPTTYPEPLGPPRLSPDPSEIIASRDGGFLDIQVVRSGSPDTPFLGTRSIAQFIPAGGADPGPAHEILFSGGPEVVAVRAAELDSGGWLVAALMEGDPGVYPPILQIQTLDATGRPIAPPTVFGAGPDGQTAQDVNFADLDPEIFATGNAQSARWDFIPRSDGNVVVLVANADPDTSRVLGQAYDATGTPVGDRLILDLASPASFVRAAATPDGEIAFSAGSSPGVSANQIGILSEENDASAILYSAETPFDIDRLLWRDGSEFAYTYTAYIASDYGPASYDITLRTGDETGLNAPLRLSSARDAEYDITVLNDRLFALVEGPATNLSGSLPVTVDIRDAEGWNYGRTTVFTPQELQSRASNGPAQSERVGGQLLIWTEAGLEAGERRLFKSLDLPAEVAGTAAPDTLAATAPSFLRAGGGDDRVTGSSGNDVLDGGAGSDTLHGGDGNDILRVGGGNDVAHGGRGSDLAHVDIFDRMFGGSERPAGLVYPDLFRLDPDGTLHLDYADMAMTFRSVEYFSFNGYNVSYNRILSPLFAGQDDFIDNSTSRAGVTAAGGGGDDRLIGSAAGDQLFGGTGADQILGGLGADELHGGDDADYIHGADPLEDSTLDRRDRIFAGSGDDTVFGSYGNDLIYGMDGNDVLSGGFGADEVIGQNGNDTITGAAFADLLFGNAGDDFINGGFGHDLINGGAGADRFFHIGGTADQMAGHGSDWVQDYDAAEGDVLLFGGAASAAQFQVNFTHTANRTTGERSGDDDLQEAFVIYRPTGQILWALVDGAGQASINLQTGGEVFDLLG